MSPQLANFLFEAVNFLLLAAVLGWLLFRPVRRALDAERQRHDAEVEEARRLRQQAEALAQATRAAHQAAAAEIAEERRRALDAAREEADRLLAEARKAEAEERRRSQQELEASCRQQAAALAETLGRVAARSLAGLLETLDGPSLDRALVRAACRELEALAELPRGTSQGPLRVDSARPLDDEERMLLEGVLGKGFEEQVIAELGAGVRVTTARGQVEATAASLARRAAREVGEAATAAAAGEETGDG